MFPRECTYLYRPRFLKSELRRPSYVGTTANVGTCSACSYWSVVSESGTRVEYGGHVWHEMLPTKYVLGRMDMVLGQLETVGRNWTLRASLQRGIIKAIVRFPSRVLRGLDLKPNAKIKLLPPSVRSKTRDIQRLECFMRLSSRWIVLTQLFSLRPGIKTYFDDILMFDHEAGYNGEWRQIESMKIKRTFHSMSVVNFNKIKDYCN